MKLPLISPILAAHFSGRRAWRSIALPVLIASALSAAPVSAFAAHATKHHRKTEGATVKTAAADKNHLTHGRRRHGANAVRAVAFQPHTLNDAPFGLRESSRVPMLRSTVGYVVDENTRETLFDKNSTAVVPIASVTKLMTSMVVLDSKASLTEPLTTSDDDRDLEKHTGSRLPIGATLDREDMLHIALMASENRAAAALSRYYPGGRPGFIAAMNAKAKALGMTDTHFESPSGLTSKNVSTARDLVKMVDAAYQYPLIRQFSTDKSYDVNTGRRKIAYRSTNALIRDPRWTIGLQKTGFINEAGICLVMQTTINDRPVVMVLLDSSGRYSDFADATTLRSYLGSDERPRITAIVEKNDGT